MQSSEIDPAAALQTETMVAESGNYELLKQRLSTQGDVLLAKTQALNTARLAAFGQSEQTLVMRTRARTENNCVPRDIVRVGDLLLFGFNVFIGLRQETTIQDVFALYRLTEDTQEQADGLEAVPLTGSFLEDTRFSSDFRELYAYYKQATLQQFRVTQDKLLIAFQIGQQVSDLRVFRWNIARDGSLQYHDNRGERDMVLPPSHDFEWTPTTREDAVMGKFPHVSIQDLVFIETTGGDLTVKIENNTETGRGIYSEPVEDKNQSLTDAEIAYARVGMLILLKIRPYREQVTRYLVYNLRTQKVERIDAIGDTCIQLPEDHGILFPGGCYLQSGEYKQFDLPADVVRNLRFKRMLKSPNGEDVLYVFYQPNSGYYALFTYNLINKSLTSPIVANGYARIPDGRILVFQADRNEATRSHPMQLWQTAFYSDDHNSHKTSATGFWGRIGNPDLVRGISDLMGIARSVREQAPTRAAYEDLIRQCERANDAYFWLDSEESGSLQTVLQGITDAARNTLLEFEKVDAIRRETAHALAQAEAQQHSLSTDIASTIWRTPDHFMQALARLRAQRGQLQMLKDLRYVDLARVQAMDAELEQEQQRVGERAMQFLAAESAFDSYRKSLDNLAQELPQAQTSPALGTILSTLDNQASGLDLLTEQLGNLPGGDAVIRTAILDRISTLYTDINRLRAEARIRRKELGATESAAEFGAQFKLFGQAVENALEFADSPEKCDDALTRLLAQLEELEGRFAEQDQFLADIANKREAVYEALSARRQSLVDAQQRRAQTLTEAAGRILDGIARRVSQLGDIQQVHSYFAADPLLSKLRNLTEDLRKLGAAVAADELDTRLKTARDQAVRSVRDKGELIAQDGQTLRFGRHSFTINRQALDLTLMVKDQKLVYHLSGTDYMAPANDVRLNALTTYWDQALVSETAQISRAHYLAGLMLQAALTDEHDSVLGDWNWSLLQTLAQEDPHGDGSLLAKVRLFCAPRYQEGYLKGVHDTDAARLLAAVVRMQANAGLLAWSPSERALALLYWHNTRLVSDRETLHRNARAALQMQKLFGQQQALNRLEAQTAETLFQFSQEMELGTATDKTQNLDSRREQLQTTAHQSAAYLIRQLASERGGEVWVISSAGADLAAALLRSLENSGSLSDWQHDLNSASPRERWQLAHDWVSAYVQQNQANLEPNQLANISAWIDDAASALAFDVPRERINATLDQNVDGLLSEHPSIVNGTMVLNLNHFWQCFLHHTQHIVPGFQALQNLRHALLTEEKNRLRLTQFQAKPLATFVRNQLIDEVYLPMIGANLAKQIGATGEGNRTDRMGLLLLISPPGYGKTTLMEYVADRLGLIFVRINCPVIGHNIGTLDPSAITDSGARQELEKLNLGLAMGNNVMLYLDDIQHTSPEFLQKFIALADGTRRIEGVWDGQPRTYDLRGKRFALVMAGNPYTESGDVFKIPDMLANRADIYNLGDVLSGRESLFALSYIENCLTANPNLMPLASRDPKDVALLVQLAQGGDVATSALSHPYSAVELEELSALLQRLFRARDLLLKVNLAYIESAAQQDNYRTEPPFKLQGSYRNMTKLAAQITPLMQDHELDALLRDHYRGEAQTLTTGAEENLLKLAQLLGTPSAEESTRWKHMCDEFTRQRKLGGADTDGSTRIASSLLDVARAVEELKPTPSDTEAKTNEGLKLAEAVLAIAVTYRKVLMPLISATEHRLKLDQSIHTEVELVSQKLEALEQRAARNAVKGGGK